MLVKNVIWKSHLPLELEIFSSFFHSILRRNYLSEFSSVYELRMYLASKTESSYNAKVELLKWEKDIKSNVESETFRMRGPSTYETYNKEEAQYCDK